MSHCNVCWEPLQGQANIAACGHLFCDSHAETALDAAEGCPLCGGQMSHTTLKVVPVEPADSALESALLGLNPDAIAQAAHKAVEWWGKQTELTYQEFMRRAGASHAQREQRYKAKLAEVHDAYKKAKAKNAQQAEEMQLMAKDRDELRAKFEQKSREKRMLDDSMKALQSENQHLKAGGGGGNTALAAMHHHDVQHDAALATALHASATHGGSLMRPAPVAQFTRTGNASGGHAPQMVTCSIHATQYEQYTTTAVPAISSGGRLMGGGGLMDGPGRSASFNRLQDRNGGSLLAGGAVMQRNGNTSPAMTGYPPLGANGHGMYNPGGGQQSPVLYAQGAPLGQPAAMPPWGSSRRGGPSAAPSPAQSPRRARTGGVQFGARLAL